MKIVISVQEEILHFVVKKESSLETIEVVEEISVIEGEVGRTFRVITFFNVELSGELISTLKEYIDVFNWFNVAPKAR